ncbi:hypothetical protein B0E37_02474 [Streptomyces sp. MH192]|nr:hypothetical protein [Streptomyces sp. MH192]MCF0101765.1 hypothetical protein [Streptomyces sp. MH191]
MRGELPQPYVGGVRELADPGQGQPGHPQRAVQLRQDVSARLGQRRGQLLPLLLLALGGADPGEVGGVGGDEVPHAHVGEELPAADDDEVVGGERHLAHQVGGDEDRTALRREGLHQVPHPEDAFGVEAVDRLVEEQHLGVAEERGGDAEALAHAEREALGAAPGHVLQADDAEHLVDAALRDAGELREAEEVVAGAAPAVHGLGVQQGADVPGGAGEPAVGVAADGDVARGGVVQTEDHAHGGGLAGAVRTEEAGHHARPYLEGKVVHGRLVAVALGQADCLDHSPHPSTGSGRTSGRTPPVRVRRISGH